MELTPDIIEARALENYYIYLKFDTGEEKVYNMEETIENLEFYSKLKDRNYFECIKVRGDTIEWENGEDIAPENLYNNSIPFNEYKGN